jgi:tol-pal system protein YbgF
METQKVNLAQMQGRVASHDTDVAQMKVELATMKESQAMLLSQTADYAKELQSLRGRFEENRYTLDKTIKDLTTELELQRARIAGIEGKAAPAPVKDQPKPADTKGAADKDATDVSQPAGDPRTLYDDAHIALKEKRYDEARTKFQQFIKDYPKDPLAPNCYYWIGETLYAEKKFEDAVLAYDKFLQGYPKHDKARAALLKQGYCFIELGDVKTGKTILEMVVEKYPKTAEADLAKKKLDSLASKTKAPTPKKTDKKKR